MEKTSTQVTFQLSGGSSILRFDLDDTLNTTKTIFYGDDKCYFRVFSDAPITVLEATNGSITQHLTDQELTITDYVTFYNANTSTVSYPIKNLISTQWYGSSLGNVVYLDQTTLKSAYSGFGVLKATYTSKYDVYYLTVPNNLPDNETGKIIIYGVNDNGAENHLTIDVSGTIFSDKDIIINVKDYDLDIDISAAEVFVDGVSVGFTDQFGKINLGKIAKGTHSLKVIKTGYKDTDTDALNNDFFIVK